MKVYIVLPDYGYEGYGEPMVCFDTLAAAEEWSKNNQNTSVYENRIHGIEVNSTLNQYPSEVNPIQYFEIRSGEHGSV